MITKKHCTHCAIAYKSEYKHQKYCSVYCKEKARYEKRQQLRPSVPIDNGTQGASSELRVVIDLISKGYMVFRNVCPTGSIDLIAVERGKNGSVLRVEVKTCPRGSEVKTKYNECFFDHLAVVNYSGNITYYPEMYNGQL